MTYRCGYGNGWRGANIRRQQAWTLDDAGKTIVRIGAMSGRLLPQSLTIPEEVSALSFSIDTYSIDFLPNRGKDRTSDVRKHIPAHLAATFGTTGGVFAQDNHFKAGEAGEYRFRVLSA